MFGIVPKVLNTKWFGIVPSRKDERMPREGYRSITVKEAVYCHLEKLATESHRTVPELIEHLAEAQIVKEV